MSESTHHNGSQFKTQVDQFNNATQHNILPVNPIKNNNTNTAADDLLKKKNQTIVEVDKNAVDQMCCGNGTGIFEIIIVENDDDSDPQRSIMGSFFNNGIIMDDFLPEIGFL